MRIAESLYMAGFISYPRVDNTVYPSSLDLRETVWACSSPATPQYAPYCEGSCSPRPAARHARQEGDDRPPADLPDGNAATPTSFRRGEFKLYNLIARRFLATLSNAAVVGQAPR
jgi:DNA topoisomerase-1